MFQRDLVELPRITQWDCHVVPVWAVRVIDIVPTYHGLVWHRAGVVHTDLSVYMTLP